MQFNVTLNYRNAGGNSSSKRFASVEAEHPEEAFYKAVSLLRAEHPDVKIDGGDVHIVATVTIDGKSITLEEAMTHLPLHAAIILKVQHSNMAPADEPPSKWWYHDSHKGWDYLSGEGYHEYQRLMQVFPEIVQAHEDATMNAIRASMAPQISALFN